MEDVKIFASLVEESAKKQIDVISKEISFRDQKIRIMPDVHAGMGCVIGFTSTIGIHVIPNIVGVDIGCGVLVAELGKTEIDFGKLDDVIRKYVPSGTSIHPHDKGGSQCFSKIKCLSSLRNTQRFSLSLGTLGGGNHFIEVDVDEQENKYLLIHTGSRNLGKQVADYYQKLAYDTLNNTGDVAYSKRKLVEQYIECGKQSEIQGAVESLSCSTVDKDLAYLCGSNKDDYLHDMKICQQYANENRIRILSAITTGLSISCENLNFFTTMHNYIDTESMIVRKGAVSAYNGERLVIPLNMRDGSIIAVGKGNEDWNCSAPHGAGRIMSRSKARKEVSMDEYTSSMKGIYTSCVNPSTIDESPMSYKDMNEILDNIGDTVQIERIIKPVYNFKASE